MNTDMDNFIGLSAVLTGFNESILSPFLDPVDVKQEYWAVFNEKVASETGQANLVAQILAQYALLKQQNMPNPAIGETLLSAHNSDAFVHACRQLIFMWYSGAWPTVLAANASSPASTVSDVISPKTYTSGLVWQVMQSHPMGDSNYRYGYWAQTPAPLAEYTGNPLNEDHSQGGAL